MENTTENILIADFMCLKYYPHNMKYDTSWDWLMPVVEKIEGLGYMFSIAEKEAFTCHNENNTDGDFECVSKSKIASAHYVAVKFIKWYNLKQHTSC